jgi:hypothetical protein
VDQEEFDAEVSELEIRLERLRSLYEQYFLGIERIEPSVARKDVDRRFWRIRKVKLRNTAKRFKLQTLIQRYNTLQQYWTRTCRKIENGTYIRHVQRVKRRAANDASAQATQPQPTAARAARGKPPAAKPGLNDARVQQLHQQLVEAQQRLQPGSRGVSLKALAQSLRMTQERLNKKHEGQNIDFKVVERDGHAAIQPVLRKKG